MPVTGDEIRESLGNPLHDALSKEGISLQYLVQKLKRELNAKVTKTQKIKGKVGKDPEGKPKLMRGMRVLAEGDKLETDKAGTAYDDGDSILAWDEIAWDVRQKARMDAHKLRGDYPADKVEHGGEIDLRHQHALTPELEEILDAFLGGNRG